MSRKPTTYGYARVSTSKQSIERQISNIQGYAPDAVILTEAFTGTKMERPIWSKLYKKLQAGDTVVFDEVSRMSRNAEEGFTVYEDLYQRGVNLVFLKEPGINTDVYRGAAQRRIEATVTTGNTATDTFTAAILEAVNNLLMDLAKQQIAAAFDKAQAEVEFLHKRTSEGVKAAQRRIAQWNLENPENPLPGVGRQDEAHIETKKGKAAKEIIAKHSKDFGGNLSDDECMKLAGISRNSFYKYKKELRSAE